MKLRKIFASKVAAAALAISLTGGSVALADEVKEPPVSSPDPVITETIQQKQSGQGQLTTSLDVEFNPLSPYAAAIGGMAGAAFLISLYQLARRKPGAPLLRTGVSLAFTLALLNPEPLLENREILPTEVVVAVDRSASQSLGDRAEATEAMRAALVEEIKKGIENVNIRIVEVDDMENGSAVNGTNVFGALDKTLADIPSENFGAVIVMTDGQVDDVPDKQNGFVGAAPVHALISGREGEYDRRIVIDNAPSYGIVNEEVTIKFRVLDEGVIPGMAGNVRVTITGDGEPLSSRIVTPGEVVEMTLDVPHGGSNIIGLKVAPLAGELTEVNNRVVTSIEGVRETLRVLLVSGQPSPGERALRELLKSGPALELVHVGTLRTQDDDDEVPLKELSLISVPTRKLFAEQLDKFDLVIFDRYQHFGSLPPMYYENVSRYVSDGGSLLVVAGPGYASPRSLYRTPLAPVLPAAPNGDISEKFYRPQVSGAGERHPVTRALEGDAGPDNTSLDDKEWGRWSRQIGVDDVSGDVVMEDEDGNPLLILNHEKEGRVAMLLSDKAWLWARGYEGGGPHDELLQRVSHWLMEEPALEEEALRLSTKDGEITIEQQTMADKSDPVKLRTPSGKLETVKLEKVAPGLWRATIPADEIGLYQAEQGDKKSSVNAGAASPKEFAGTLSSVEPLKSFVEASGGQVRRMADGAGKLIIPRVVARSAGEEEMSGTDWIGIRKNETSILRDVSRLPMPDALPLAVLLLTLGATWYKEGGLPSPFRKDTWKKMLGKGDGPSI